MFQTKLNWRNFNSKAFVRELLLYRPNDKSWSSLVKGDELKILTRLQKLPKSMGDLGKLIVAKGFEKLPKVQ